MHSSHRAMRWNFCAIATHCIVLTMHSSGWQPICADSLQFRESLSLSVQEEED